MKEKQKERWRQGEHDVKTRVTGIKAVYYPCHRNDRHGKVGVGKKTDRQTIEERRKRK